MKNKKLAQFAVLLCATWVNLCFAGNFSTGLIFSSESEYQSFPKAQKYRAYLPETVDLSYRFPKAGNQGRQGSCVGWSVAYGARSYYDFDQADIKTNPSLAFSPAFIYNQIKENAQNCEEGSSISRALNLLKTQGVPRLADFPYADTNCGRQPTAAIRELALRHKIKSWKAIPSGAIETVKGELYRGNPVIVGMAVSSSFDDLRGKNIYADEKSGFSGEHAMVITGYDDKRGAFKLLNSWGPDWGDNGFGWVGYRAMALRGKEFFVMEPESRVVPPPEPPPEPPPAPIPPPAPSPPKPSNDAIRQQVQVILSKIECSTLKVDLSGQGIVTISGVVGKRSEVDEVEKTIADITGVSKVEVQIKEAPWPICEALQTLALSTKDVQRVAIALIGKTGSSFTDGEKLAFEIKLSSKSGYLYVDYLQANGEAIPLIRGESIKAGKTVRLPQGGKQFTVQAPFGSELLVVITSPKPLIESGTKYGNDREYLSALRQALLKLSEQERSQIYSATLDIKTIAK